MRLELFGFGRYVLLERKILLVRDEPQKIMEAYMSICVSILFP